MIALGVDPGLRGALARCDSQGAVEVMAMPLVKGGIGGRDRINVRGIVECLEGFLSARRDGEPILAVLERGQPLPASMGGSSASFARGYGLGLFEALFAALRIPYEAVSPRQWQRVMLAGIPGEETKQRSILAAQCLFPNISLLPTARSRQPSDGFADALLLAEYGRRRLLGRATERVPA